MGILLALAGLALVGGAISAVGSVLEGQQKASEAELAAQKSRESIPILQAQLRAMAADRLSAGERLALRERGLAIQGIRTAQAGARAQGSIGAMAGAGNLGGVSPLRQARAIQRQTELGMTEIAGQQREAKLGYEDILRNIDVRTLATQYDIRWAELGAGQLEDQAGFYRKYGWLSAAGEVLGAGAGALSLF